MTHKFNPNKPYADVFGGNLLARYLQNDVYFDHLGNPVDPAAQAGEAQRPEQAQPAQASAPQPVQLTAEEEAALAQKAVDDALAVRRGKLVMEALPILSRNVADIVAELEDHDADLLAVMLELEGVAGKRKTVLDSLATAIAAKAEQAEADRRANEPPVNAATGSFGTMSGENQLQNQLSS